LDGQTLLVTSKNEIIKPDTIKQLTNEGMPMFDSKKKKDRGHLYVQFEVEFPKTVPKEIQEKLKEVLPPPKEKVIEIKEGDDVEEVTLTDPNFENYTTGDTSRNEAYLSDEEERGNKNGGGGGCQTN
jgi:DnaJ homolog subfamily A member 2